MRHALLIATLALAAGGCDDDTTADTGSADMVAADPVARGAFYVEARGCATCHQSMAAGAGTLAGADTPRPGTMAYPANLTPDVDTGIGSWSDDIIIRAMRSGVDDQDQPLCPPMPHFDGTGGDGRPMTDDEATSIVAYLHSLAPVHHAVPASSCPPLKSPGDDGSGVDMAIPDAADMRRPHPRDLALPPSD